MSVQLPELRRAIEPFEVQCDIGALAGGDQVAAGELDRVAAVLLVAGQDDFDVRALERSGGFHRPKRGHHHRHAALVVARARPLAVIAFPGPALEGTVGFVDRVEVTDEEEPLGAPPSFVTRNDVARAARRLHVDPFDLEAQRLQLGAEHLADLRHALDVERTAVLVDPFLEHGERPILLRIDGRDHSSLRTGQLGAGGNGSDGERKGGKGTQKHGGGNLSEMRTSKRARSRAGEGPVRQEREGMP